METQTFIGRPVASLGASGEIELRDIKRAAAVELDFEPAAIALADVPSSAAPGDAQVVRVDGVERYFWPELNALLMPRRDLRRVKGRDLRRKEIRVITTDDGRRHAFLMRRDLPREVTEAIPPGRRATVPAYRPALGAQAAT